MSNKIFEEFLNSNLSRCFIPDGDGIFLVKTHADAPRSTEYMLGSVGDSLGTPEHFKIVECPHLYLAVGDKATIVKITEKTIELPFPTFAKKYFDYDGYKNISTHFKAPSYRVGRLVALVWMSLPEDADVVDHIDGNRTNDALANLEWVTYSENIRRSRPNKHRRWSPNDFALMVHREKGALICHPTKISSISGSGNLNKVLDIPNKHSLKGWYPLINPTLEDALEFIRTLPFEVDPEDIIPLFDESEIA